MECLDITSLTPDWIREKLRCINRSAWNNAERTRNRIRDNRENGQPLAPDVFAEILVFKGLARSKKAFLNNYQHSNTIQEITQELFQCGLWISALN